MVANACLKANVFDHGRITTGIHGYAEDISGGMWAIIIAGHILARQLLIRCPYVG